MLNPENLKAREAVDFFARQRAGNFVLRDNGRGFEARFGAIRQFIQRGGGGLGLRDKETKSGKAATNRRKRPGRSGEKRAGIQDGERYFRHAIEGGASDILLSGRERQPRALPH